MSFSANYKAIAEGIFEILQDMAGRGDEAYLGALAFGMLPAPLMEMAERQFVEKLAQPAIAIGCPKETAIKAVKQGEEGKRYISEFNHGLSVALLGVAKANNNLVV